VGLPLSDVIVHEFDQFRWLFAQEIVATTAVKVRSKSARPLRCSKGAVEGSPRCGTRAAVRGTPRNFPVARQAHLHEL
jgi:predicted dehydrogenase